MPTPPSDVLFIGIGGHVVAIHPATGEELWRTKLDSSSLVTIFHSGARVFAGDDGVLFCLDAATGHILWSNKLAGLGLGPIFFSSTGEAASFAAPAEGPS